MKILMLFTFLLSTLTITTVNVVQKKEVIKTAKVKGSQDEGDIIKNVVEQFYVKGLKERNFALIRAICISETKLYGVRNDSSLNVTTLDQWSKNFDPGNPPFKTLNYKIQKIDIEGNAAQVKILLIINGDNKIYDFLNLLKIKGNWRIVNIIDY